MMMISQRQIQAFDAVALAQFLKKVTQFLNEQIPEELSRMPDREAAIRAAYSQARRAGNKTERAIVQFILDDLTHKSR